MNRLFAVLIFSLLATPAAAQDFDEGSAAYKRGDYAATLREWQPLAERGLAKAQHSIGIMYANGQGVPQDFAAAARWYRLAAARVSRYSRIETCMNEVVSRAFSATP